MVNRPCIIYMSCAVEVPVVSLGKTKSEGNPSISFFNFSISSAEISSSSSRTCRLRFLSKSMRDLFIERLHPWCFSWWEKWYKHIVIHIIYALTVLSVKCTQETACGHPASSPPNRAWPASHTCLSSGPLRVYREGAGEAGSRGCQSCLARGVSITRARIIQSHPGLGSFLSRWNHFKIVSASEAKIKHILW